MFRSSDPKDLVQTSHPKRRGAKVATKSHSCRPYLQAQASQQKSPRCIFLEGTSICQGDLIKLINSGNFLELDRVVSFRGIFLEGSCMLGGPHELTKKNVNFGVG